MTDIYIVHRGRTAGVVRQDGDLAIHFRCSSGVRGIEIKLCKRVCKTQIYASVPCRFCKAIENRPFIFVDWFYCSLPADIGIGEGGETEFGGFFDDETESEVAVIGCGAVHKPVLFV